MLITADQIRAARALKNWSQTDLADRTGLAVPTIANIELGKQVPGKNTIEKIIDAFSIGGIRFTSNGVEFDKDDIVTIIGDEKFKDVLYDVMRTLENKPAKEREFIIYSAEDARASDEEVAAFNEIKSKNIIYKRIISDQAKTQPRTYCVQRAINHKYFDETGAVVVYGDKVAFYTAPEGNNDAITRIISNQSIAETQKKILSYMWDNLKETPQTEKPKKKGRK